MDNDQKASLTQTTRPWVLMTGTALALLSMSQMLSRTIVAVQVLYLEMQIKDLPLATELVVKWGGHCWILVLIAAVWGVQGVKKYGDDWAMKGCLLALVIFLSVGALLISQLLYPLSLVHSAIK